MQIMCNNTKYCECRNLITQEVNVIQRVQDLLQKTLDHTVEQIRYAPIRTHTLVLNCLCLVVHYNLIGVTETFKDYYQFDCFRVIPTLYIPFNV